MKLTEFDINILNLSNNTHHFHYDIGDEFFALFDNSPVEKSNAEVNINLQKQETLLNLEFIISGTIELICDRSLEKFDYPIEIRESVVYKFGHEDKELSEEVQVIKFGTPQINVAQYIYEFIGLAVPMKKLHPDYDDEEEEEASFEEGTIIYTSEAESEDEDAEEGDDELADPRWEILKYLKDN